MSYFTPTAAETSRAASPETHQRAEPRVLKLVRSPLVVIGLNAFFVALFVGAPPCSFGKRPRRTPHADRVAAYLLSYSLC